MRYFLLSLLVAYFFFSCQSSKSPTAADPLFVELAPLETGVNFQNHLPEDTAGMNIIEYLYYYNGGGVAVGDVNNDGLPDLFFTANWGKNRLFLNKGNLHFEDATEKSGIGSALGGGWKTGATMADVNGDGWLDIYVCAVGDYKSFKGKNQLFINLHDGRFEEKAADFGLAAVGFCTQAAFFDADGDGDLDCFLLKHSVHTPASYRPAADTRQPDRLASDQFFLNENGVFVDKTADSGLCDGISGYGLGVVVGDVNSDGRPDIFVSNDFHENDFLYLNRGGGHFENTATASFGHCSNFSMGCDLADANNDGLPDLISLDMKPAAEPTLKASAGADAYDIFQFKLGYGYGFQFSRNAFQLNRGCLFDEKTPVFSEIAQFSGIAATDWSWSPLLADFDGDGWRDLFISNGIRRRPNDIDFNRFISSENAQRNATDRQLFEKMPRGDVPNFFFKNNGATAAGLTFSNESTTWISQKPSCTNGAAYADLDGDGDLDLVLNNLDATASILKNMAHEKGANFLTIKCLGEKKNPFGIGATARIWLPDGLEITAENQPTRGFESSCEPIFHFGFGKNQQADSLEIRWPDGKTERLRNVAANQILTVKQSDAQKNRLPQKSKIAEAEPPIFQKQNIGISFQHIENQFIDIEREKLMPWLLSTQSPRLAVADFDKNGLDDVAIGGASGQGLQLFFQKKTGFERAAEPDFEVEKSEITALAAFDADGDGDLDLYAGAGGNEGFQGKSRPDRLFLNDGGGHFSEKKDALPELTDNAACVRAADFDGDGDLDLFVGSRSVSGRYGLAPLHFLLKNDGKGRFERVEKTTCPDFSSLGMVTDAAWADVNGDQRLDLVVVGEWMPLTIFLNENGTHFSKMEVPKSAGLWNCLATGDFDGDGDVDFAAGNLGLNSNLQTTENQPLSLFVKDFDGNGSTEPILVYWKQNRRWTVANRDELISQLPFLKKQFVENRAFADSPFEAVFSKKMLTGAVERRAETLASTLFLNDGRGHFSMKPLPDAAQFSPTEAILTDDFDGDGKLDLLLAGNFYEVQPSIGRFDASFGTFLRGDGRGNFEAVEPKKSGFAVHGAVRDLKKLGRDLLLVGVNNGPLEVFKINRKTIVR